MSTGAVGDVERSSTHLVVAALGNDLRRDDGAGPAVLAELRARPDPVPAALACLGSPFDLLGVWDGVDLAVIVDALGAGDRPGEVHVIELSADGRGAGGSAQPVSSHGGEPSELLDLAEALGTAPARLVLVGIEGADFGHGAGLSEPVRRGVPRAAEIVTELLSAVPARSSSSASTARSP